MSFAVTKDPQALLDYSVDWALWLAGDTIATSSWTVPDGLTNANESNTNTVATVWLSGGTDKMTYTIVNHITTAGGRADDRSIIVRVRGR